MQDTKSLLTHRHRPSKTPKLLQIVSLYFTPPMAPPLSIPSLSTFKTPVFPPIRPLPAIKIRTCVKALREWREYEDAVRDKDLARALQFLKSMQFNESNSSVSSISSSPPSYSGRFLRPERDWEVLDTCLNADDMRLVGSAYKFLQDRGFLENFGKYRNIGEGFALSFCM